MTNLACKPPQGYRLASTATGSHIAYSTCDTEQGHIYVHNLDSNARVDVAGDTKPGGWVDLKFSSDGQRVAWFTGGTIFVARTDGTGAVAQVPGGNRAWSFSPDGTRVVLFTKGAGSGADGEVVSVGVDGTGSVTLDSAAMYLDTGKFGSGNKPDVFAPRTPAFTPDGRLVYVVNSTGAGTSPGVSLVIVKLDGTGRVTVPNVVDFFRDSLGAADLIGSVNAGSANDTSRIDYDGTVHQLAPKDGPVVADATTVYFGGFNKLFRIPRAGGTATTVTMDSGGDWVLTPDGYLIDNAGGKLRVTAPSGTPVPVFDAAGPASTPPFAPGGGVAFTLDNDNLLRFDLSIPKVTTVDGPKVNEAVLSGDRTLVHYRANDALGMFHAEHRVVPVAGGAPKPIFDSLGGMSFPAGIPEPIRGRNDWVIRTVTATQPVGTETLHFVQVP